MVTLQITVLTLGAVTVAYVLIKTLKNENN